MQRSRSERGQRGELGSDGMVRRNELCLYIVAVLMGEVDVRDAVEVVTLFKCWLSCYSDGGCGCEML